MQRTRRRLARFFSAHRVKGANCSSFEPSVDRVNESEAKLPFESSPSEHQSCGIFPLVSVNARS